MRRFSILLVVVCFVVLAQAGACAIWGRDRDDLAAWVSADDGLFAFSKPYNTGKVSPFAVGEERGHLRERLRLLPLLPSERKQIETTDPTWRISRPALSGGYITYTTRFANGHVATIAPYYSVFAGL